MAIRGNAELDTLVSVEDNPPRLSFRTICLTQVSNLLAKSSSSAARKKEVGMRRALVCILPFCVIAFSAFAQDAVKVDPQHYKF
jgi:hypothetical protein